MKCRRKNKLKTLQRIRFRRWQYKCNKIKRTRKRRKKRTQLISKRKPSAPRKFRRIVGSYNQHFNKEKSSKRRNHYINNYLPTNLNYLLKTKESPFYLKDIEKEKIETRGQIEIPEIFSIIEKSKESYLTLRKIISALLLEDNDKLVLDYKNCIKVELSSQVLLDIILKDSRQFAAKCKNLHKGQRDYFSRQLSGINIDNADVQKMMFSIGSPVSLDIGERRFPDIIPYKLCIHNNEKEKDYDKRIEQKELDTTEMADYVIDCLERMNNKLTPTKRDDLCTVIGEVLINAEEHSTTKYRFSIGYFKEENVDNKHFGIFRLVILNFGKTIYEKFKDDDCPNKDIVAKMKNLSESYTQKRMFRKRLFEEENLWTLYALQEEVSSVSPMEYKRGNGSIRFIDSFFNIKGSNDVDNTSLLTIQSGYTRIHFNGQYNIQTKTNLDGDSFKVMTFNESGNIEDKPDSKYVYQTKEYFPGTIISAKLLFNDDDVEQLEN